MSHKLETGIRFRQFFTNPLFFLTVIVASSVWLIEPLLHVANSNQNGTLGLMDASLTGVYYHLAVSVIILVMGFSSIVMNLRMKNYYLSFKQEQELLSAIIEAEPECVKTVAADGSILSMNRAGLNLVEADSFETIDGASVFGLIAPEYQQQFKELHESVIAGKGGQLQYDLIGLKGSRRTMETHAVPLASRSGKGNVHLGVTRDITEAKVLSNRLHYQATHDMLTGLVNRAEFEQRLEQSLKRANADKCAHAVFFIDLDQFKVINDTCGHFAGDQLLKQAAAIFRSQLRAHDTVARLGGDEFAVLLEYCSEEEAEELATKLRAEIEVRDFIWEDRSFRYTCSIGLVMIDYATPSLAEVLKNVDAACYIAKDRGRNCVYMHRTDDDSTLQKIGEMHWIAKIHEGINSNRFMLYAQLIQGLGADQNSLHAEVLLRYVDDDGSSVPPGAFLPAAERYGVMSQVDRYVVASTLDCLKENRRLLERVDLICINLSGQSIADEDFLNFAIDQLTENAEFATYLCFEITETAAISNLNSANHFIRTMRALGCRFSLDDFGSGLSSFAYLKNLPVDYVKIDGEFVRDIATDTLNLAVIKSINEIAHLLGKQTVAEYVENDEIKRLLVDVGVNYVQGYGIHKPQPIGQLRESLLQAPVAHVI